MTDLDRHLAAIAAGDAQAFADWLAGAEPRIRGSLRGFAAQVDVEAVLQETLLRVWQVAPRFTPDGRADGLVRLGVRIGRNLAVSEMRRRRVPVEELGPDDVPVAPIEPDPLLREALRRCREALKGPPAVALALRLDDGGARPDRDLAVAAGMSTNTFLQNVRRARLALEQCLEKAGIRLSEVSP